MNMFDDNKDNIHWTPPADGWGVDENNYWQSPIGGWVIDERGETSTGKVIKASQVKIAIDSIPIKHGNSND